MSTKPAADQIADLNGDLSAQTAAEIAKETGNECRGMACNVTREADIDAVVKTTVGAFGGISTLVKNVGWGNASPIRRRSPMTCSLSPTSSTPSAPTG